MIPIGNIISRIQGMIDDDSTETKADILLHANAEYAAIAESHPFQSFIEEITVASSLILPADLVRMLYAQDDTDYIYFNINIPDRYSSNRLYNYFRNLTVTTPLLTGTDLVVTANSTEVTSAGAGFTSAHVGEYMKIGENPGIYKVSTVDDASTIQLTKAYRGASDTAQAFEIRPEGTQKIAYTDEAGDALTSTSLTLWYLRRPLPLYNDYDSVLLPGQCEALRIGICRRMDESDKYDNDSLKRVPDYNIELEKMKSLNPWKMRHRTPRNRLGGRVRFGRTGIERTRVTRDGRVYL